MTAMDRYNHSTKGRMTQYRYWAKRRGLVFELSLEEFSLLLDSPCHYCGEEVALGIDRVDNGVGYTTTNVVPCCEYCNKLKGLRDYDEFTAKVRRIAQYMMKLEVS